MAGTRIGLGKAAKLSPDALLALEDYARAASNHPASVVVDPFGQATAIKFGVPEGGVPEEVVRDIERFYESLVSDSAERLGWS